MRNTETCAYGDAPAQFVVHDRRGCYAVCRVHAVWRRTWCSRIGGHQSACATPEERAHVVDLDGKPVDDAVYGSDKLPEGWTSISGCGS